MHTLSRRIAPCSVFCGGWQRAPRGPGCARGLGGRPPELPPPGRCSHFPHSVIWREKCTVLFAKGPWEGSELRPLNQPTLRPSSPAPQDSGGAQRFFRDRSLGGTVPARPGLGQCSLGPGRGLVREAPAARGCHGPVPGVAPGGADSPRPASAAAQEGGGGRRVNSEGPGTLPTNSILIP